MSVKYLQMVGEVDPGGALPRPPDDGTLSTQCDGRKGPNYPKECATLGPICNDSREVGGPVDKAISAVGRRLSISRTSIVRAVQRAPVVYTEHGCKPDDFLRG
jgi:hypothetical protein